ncbi:MAG: cytochrome c oxidase assembly protein [Ilumatobacter sp.]|uniref:cytochrome c oxidase assembly protein n=1 Tax=Ilumatobacter sp. TaxID=1967498 RepID=UPI0032997D90
MLAQAVDQVSTAPWRFQWHPEVWVLVGFLVCAYTYMVRVIGPKAVPDGVQAVTRKNKLAFGAAMLTLWIASDWPMHDIGEEYLYSAHMLQHMALSYFLPPLALLATPTWLMRVLVGNGRLYAVVRFMTKPVIAGVLFNLVIMVTHIPQMVNASVESGPLHYSLHFAVVMLSLLMWMPVVGPLPELQIGPLGKCIYLFLQSVVPTVPAAWLTFAEGAVYKSYDIPVRVFGWDVAVDQQLAGAIMKIAGGVFLWTIVVFIFFKRFATEYEGEHDYRRAPGRGMPDAEIIATTDSGLTTDDVERAFASSRPHVET